MDSLAEPFVPDLSGVSISGSGWICSLSGDEADELADRLRFEGSWALGYRVRAMRTVSLDDREKGAMLEVVNRMASAGLVTGRTFAKLAAYLEDDLFAEEL